MSGLVEFLRARLAEDEQWALAASKPYHHADGNPQIPAGGVHWTWVVGDNWEPVIPNPVEDEFVSLGNDWACRLATVEKWQSGRWMMRTTYASTIEEMDASAAGHIARHDPARVLADVEAKRRIIASECSPYPKANPPMTVTLRLLALPFAGHPDYKEAWRV